MKLSFFCEKAPQNFISNQSLFFWDNLIWIGLREFVLVLYYQIHWLQNITSFFFSLLSLCIMLDLANCINPYFITSATALILEVYLSCWSNSQSKLITINQFIFPYDFCSPGDITGSMPSALADIKAATPSTKVTHVEVDRSFNY